MPESSAISDHGAALGQDGRAALAGPRGSPCSAEGAAKQSSLQLAVQVPYTVHAPAGGTASRGSYGAGTSPCVPPAARTAGIPYMYTGQDCTVALYNLSMASDEEATPGV